MGCRFGLSRVCGSMAFVEGSNARRPTRSPSPECDYSWGWIGINWDAGTDGGEPKPLPFSKQIEILPIQKLSIPGLSRDLGENTGLDEFSDQYDASRSFSGFAANLSDPCQKEREPLLPLAAITNGLQSFVVLGTMPLEEMREVQNGFGENLLFAQKKGDEQAPDPAVSVQERMNRFELRVRESYLDQKGQLVCGMNECLQGSQQSRNFMRGWRYKRCLSQRASTGTNFGRV
jgi:hypothetical protein